MLIHATITITGDAAQIVQCEGRLRRLLDAHFAKDEVTERHRGDALCYDLKVDGGIPFPAFAEASQEFPGLSFDAEWVNVEVGERCSVTIVSGRVTRHSAEPLQSGR
jgi:hypothetical protein